MENEHGIAHFIEHCLFKGTKNRRAFHILNGLDAVGGELNAYTTKEETTVYASFQNEYLEKAISLVSDIAFHSTFPAHEIKKEKDVVIDEIHSYLDSPSEQIFDDFEEQVFKDHSIGRPILGTIESVSGFKQADLKAFVARNFSTDRMVFSFVGNVSERKLKRLIDKYLGAAEATSKPLQRQPFTSFTPERIVKERESYQTHWLMGSLGYSANSEKRRPLILLNNILGGPALNSRLNMEIREKYGFTYNIESGYSAYCDTGLFSIYFGTDNKYAEKTHALVMKELNKLRQNALGTRQLNAAKKQLIGQIALAQEGTSNLMLGLGKSLLMFDRIDTLAEMYAKIEAITASDVLEVANEVLDPNNFSTLIYPGK